MRPHSAAPMRRLVPMLCLAALGYSSAVTAQGWTAGLSLGTATQQRYIVEAPVASYEDSDEAFRVYGAYMITPTQGVVASYLNLGTTIYEGPASFFFTEELEVTGIDMSYINSWAPGAQERFFLFGTAGIFIWDQMVDLTDSSGVTDFSDDGTSFSVGLGADVKLGANRANPWSIRLQWQLFKRVGDPGNSGHEYDRDIIALGASYRFGARFE